MRKICLCFRVPKNDYFIWAVIVLIVIWIYFVYRLFKLQLTESDFINVTGIIIVVLIFLIGVAIEERRYVSNQKQILKRILVEVYFLIKKSIRFEDKESTGGHIEYFKRCLEKKEGWPHHDMRELSSFLNLDAFLDKKETSSLINLMFHANDKIRLLNFYRTGELETGKKIWTYHKPFIKIVLNELESILKKIETLINSRFELYLRDKEKEGMDKATIPG